MLQKKAERAESWACRGDHLIALPWLVEEGETPGKGLSLGVEHSGCRAPSCVWEIVVWA